jgi:hypothetical protein
VDKIKLKSKREYISIAKVKEQYDGIVLEDLFDEAEKGELTLYVKGYTWRTHLIFLINNQQLHSTIHDAAFSAGKDAEYLEQLGNAIKKRDNMMEESKRLFKSVMIEDAVQDPVSNEFLTVFPNNGKYRAVYRMPINGFQPIAKITIEAYQKDEVGHPIYLKSRQSIVGLDPSNVELIVVPDRNVLLQDALDDDKLYVKKEDLQKVFPSETSASDDSKPKTVLDKNAAKGLKPETAARYQRWNEMAVALVKKNPNLKTDLAVAGRIHGVVGKGPREFYGSIRTIREHIAVKKTEL